MKKIILLSLIFCGFIPYSLLAAGIQASPAQLNLILNKKKFNAEITVVNPTADVQVFEVFADDFTDHIKSSPSSFTMEAGARKTVKITIDAQGLQNENTLSTFISVVGVPLAEGGLQARTGVKIPINLTTHGLPWYVSIPNWAYFVAATTIIAVLGFFLGKKTKNRS